MTRQDELPPVLVALFKGVLYRDAAESLWNDLLALHAQVADYVRVLGLEVILDEAEGYAYLRQREPDDDNRLPRLVARRRLGYSLSLLIALLRKRLAEHDASAGDPRLVLTRDQMFELVRTFLPERDDAAKQRDRLEADLNKAAELGFLRKLRGNEPAYEVRRIIKSFVDAQWLGELERQLAEYRAHAESQDDGNAT